MEKKELSKFIANLVEKTENEEIEWYSLDIAELSRILKDIANYSAITGGFATLNKKGDKETIVGKFKVKVFFEEDEFYFENYSFLAISSKDDYSKAIVFNENELLSSDLQKLENLYRTVELKVTDVSSIIDDWF